MRLVFASGRDTVIQRQREEIERYKMMVEDVQARAARYADGEETDMDREQERGHEDSEAEVGPCCVFCGSIDGFTREFFHVRPEAGWALTRAPSIRIVCNVCYLRDMGRIVSLAGGHSFETECDEISDEDDEAEFDLSCVLCRSIDDSTREFFDMLPEGRWAGLPPGARTVCNVCYKWDLGRICSLW